MSFLKNYFLYLILIAVIVLGGYVYVLQSSSCQTPMEYSVGTFDTRFNINKSEFVDVIEQASHVWENAVEKDLFVYKTQEKSQGPVKDFLKKYVDKYFVKQGVVVNLVYDDRQKIADQNRVLTSQVDETKQSADVIKQEFLLLQENYKKALADYQDLLKQYKSGNASRNDVEDKRLEVNALVDEINARVKKYNFLVKEANTTISTINQNSGQEFEEGRYISDEKGERIIIYEFGNKDILKRVLAHELGHALGLDHNNNPDSIMYYLNDSKNIEPTKEDVAELTAICKGR